MDDPARRAPRLAEGEVDGGRVLAEAVDAYRVALADRLLAAYALGSLAHGGFSELVSDIDLGLIVSDPRLPEDDATIQAVADAERSKGSTLHERLSVFWGTPSTLRGDQDGGRFPALDRLDLIENGRLLAGTDEARSGLPRPGASELLVTGAEFALSRLAGVQPAGEDAVEEIRCPDLLIARGVRRLTKLVLFPGALPLYSGDGSGGYDRTRRRSLPRRWPGAQPQAGGGGARLAKRCARR